MRRITVGVILSSALILLIPFAHVSAAETSTPKSTQTAKSITDLSVQSAIVASVENNRKRFGGHEPVPATLIGIWDNKGGSFIRYVADGSIIRSALEVNPFLTISALTERIVENIIASLAR